MERSDKCDCLNCRPVKKLPQMKYDGSARAEIMIGSNGGLPVHVGSIEIKTLPLLVEPWMIERVARNAVKELTQYVVDSNNIKSVN